MPRVFCLIFPLTLLGLFLWGFRSPLEGGGTKTTASARNGGILPAKVGEDSGEPGFRQASGPGRARTGALEPLEGAMDSGILAPLTAREREELGIYVKGLRGQEGPARLWCWGDDTRPEKVAAFAAAEEMVRREINEATPAATQFLGSGRWRETAVDGRASSNQGDPVVVTWSLVPDGTLLPGMAGGDEEPSDLRSWMVSLYGEMPGGALSDQPWFVYFEEAAELMSATSGVMLEFEPNDDGAAVSSRPAGVLGVRGDIRIGARFLDGDSGLLGISLGPDDGDMILDSGDGTFDLTGGDSLRLVNTLAHELGHCLGLAHVCPVDQPPFSPMDTPNFRYSRPFRQKQIPSSQTAPGSSKSRSIRRQRYFRKRFKRIGWKSGL